MEDKNSATLSLKLLTEYVKPLALQKGLESESYNIERTKTEYIRNTSRETDDELKNGTKFRKMYLAALASLINAFCMGFGTAYTATALADMQNSPNSTIHPNKDEEGWIGSLLAIGALTGSATAGNLAETLGRRGALLVSTVPFMTGWLIIALAASVPYIYVGRLVVGFCCGLVSVTAPMYLVEISTSEVRGMLGSSFQLFCMIGVVLVSCLGSFMSWEASAGFGCALSFVTLIAMFFVPESPRWLMAKGKVAEAKESVQWLQGDFIDATHLCQTIQEELDNQPQGKFTITELLTPEAYKPALLSFALMFFQQASGLNVIMFYSMDLFERAGSSISGAWATILVATVGMLATLLSSILIDKAGRKVLLLISGSFITLSLGVFGIFDYLAVTNGAYIRVQYGWLPVLCLITFMAAFSLGFGPIPWMMVGEITTVRLRSITSGIAASLNWTCAFLVTKTYYPLAEVIHDYGAYWIYAGFGLLSCFFTFFVLPETKGKSFEQIQKYFNKQGHSNVETDNKHFAVQRKQ